MIMMIRRIIYLFLLATLIVGCSKRTENLIVGEWKIEHVRAAHYPVDGMWVFYDEGRLDITKDINAIPTGTVSGEWRAFNRSIITPYIQIDGLGPKGMNGKWRIEKLTSRMLIITRVEFNDGERAGAFLRREFIRK